MNNEVPFYLKGPNGEVASLPEKKGNVRCNIFTGGNPISSFPPVCWTVESKIKLTKSSPEHASNIVKKLNTVFDIAKNSLNKNFFKIYERR